MPLNAAFTANPLNVQAEKSAAGAYRDGLATAARALANPPLAWPSLIKGDVDAFVNDLYTDIASANALASQVDQQGLTTAWNGWKDSGGAAKAQAVRVKLGLSSDAAASCGM